MTQISPSRAAIGTALTVLIFGFALSDLILAMTTVKTLATKGHQAARPFGPLLSFSRLVKLIPADLIAGVEPGIATSGIFALIAAVVSGLYLAFAKGVLRRSLQSRDSKAQMTLRRWNLAALAITALSCVIAFIMLIYAFVSNAKSSTWHWTDSYSRGQQFTRESWICQMQYQFRGKSQEWWAPTCHVAQASRWLLLPLILSLLAMSELLFHQFRQSRAPARAEVVELKVEGVSVKTVRV